ncbi:selenocysteine lyase/cysteine desulfurase [Bradyrhizobium sp. USDA 326]|uniref:Uncharacterized protein n=1 Tax=Bradyrhizobium yuanmingense TaxID=108015 RepID=A0A1C3XEQ0_9BRAD|nr:hypothetical protein IQ15_07574 [Bradyrhizobium yuanmingense]SCB50752.1 hypothetical protein GA0061099_101311 [Bradyrhizobium yuanmingense]
MSFTAIRHTRSKRVRRRSSKPIGLGAAVDYINSIGKVQNHTHEKILLGYPEESQAINFVRMIGTPAEKGRSFRLK